MCHGVQCYGNEHCDCHIAGLGEHYPGCAVPCKLCRCKAMSGSAWRWLRINSGLPADREADDKGGPVWIVGNFERILAFGLVLLLDLSLAITILGFWLGAKLAGLFLRHRNL